MVDVRAATHIRPKNVTLFNVGLNMCWNTAGNVTNVSSGPSEGLNPNANTAGKTIIPDSNDTMMTRTIICTDVVVTSCSFGMYPPYVTSMPIPTDKVKKLSPIACKMTFEVIFEKSGINRYRNPVVPPSMKNMWAAMMIKNRKTGEVKKVMPFAKTARTIGSSIVFAKPLEQPVKLFTAWTEDK